MDPSQKEVEDLLRLKARGRVPRLRAALEKAERRIAAGDLPKAKVEALKARCDEYRADLETIMAGDYPGYNGKPFGATPGITKGVF